MTIGNSSLIRSVHERDHKMDICCTDWLRSTFYCYLLKPGSHLCDDKHNTSDISISIRTRKKEHVPFFLCLCLCLCRLCYAYRTSVNHALLSENSDDSNSDCCASAVVTTSAVVTKIGSFKRGHIVADTIVSPFTRARNICC